MTRSIYPLKRRNPLPFVRVLIAFISPINFKKLFDCIASGAKGQRFESSRAYHPSLINQYLTKLVQVALSALNACFVTILSIY